MQVSWTVHRAKEHPVKTTIAGIFILLFLVFTFLTLGSILTAVAFLVLAVATHTYFLPITYTLNDSGVLVDKRIFSYTYEWTRFRRFFLTSGGVVLSPFAKPNFLDNFRGVHLLLPEDAEKIITLLKNRFERTEETSLAS